MAQLFLPFYLQSTNCGYCGDSMRRKNLKDSHIPTCHPGMPYKEAHGEQLEEVLKAERLRRIAKEEEDNRRKLQQQNQKRLEREERKREHLEQQRQAILKKQEEEIRLKELEDVRKREKKEQDKKNRLREKQLLEEKRIEQLQMRNKNKQTDSRKNNAKDGQQNRMMPSKGGTKNAFVTGAPITPATEISSTITKPSTSKGSSVYPSPPPVTMSELWKRAREAKQKTMDKAEMLSTLENRSSDSYQEGPDMSEKAQICQSNTMGKCYSKRDNIKQGRNTKSLLDESPLKGSGSSEHNIESAMVSKKRKGQSTELEKDLCPLPAPTMSDLWKKAKSTNKVVTKKAELRRKAHNGRVDEGSLDTELNTVHWITHPAEARPESAPCVTSGYFTDRHEDSQQAEMLQQNGSEGKSLGTHPHSEDHCLRSSYTEGHPSLSSPPALDESISHTKIHRRPSESHVKPGSLASSKNWKPSILDRAKSNPKANQSSDTTCVTAFELGDEQIRVPNYDQDEENAKKRKREEEPLSSEKYAVHASGNGVRSGSGLQAQDDAYGCCANVPEINAMKSVSTQPNHPNGGLFDCSPDNQVAQNEGRVAVCGPRDVYSDPSNALISVEQHVSPLRDPGSQELSITRVIKIPSTKAPGDLEELNMRKTFLNATTLDDLLESANNFQQSPDNKQILCTSCKDHPGYKPINYETNEQESCAMKSRRFRDLKKKMLDHMYLTKMHATLNESVRGSQIIAANESAGKKVMRTAYGQIKHGGSYQNAKYQLAERFADGLDIGNINHGRRFASSMTPHFYESVKRTVVKSITEPLPGTGRPRPLAVVADKSTPCRTTLQTVGVITPRNKTGELHSILLGVKPTEHCSGAGTAKELGDVLRDYLTPEQLQESVVGVAVDGAYHNTNIDWHLRKELNISEGSEPTFACTWDGAHLIELAGKTSRCQRGKDQIIRVPWIKETFDDITSSKVNYGRGKNMVAVQDQFVLDQVASQNSTNPAVLEYEAPENVKKLQAFSNTRFTTYTENVLSVFRNNYRPTVLAMEKSNDPIASKLKSAPLILRCSGLEDFYGEVGQTSLRLQSTRLYSWNTGEQMENCVSTLNRMASSLDQGDLDPKLKYFEAAAKQMRTTGKFSGIPLTDSLGTKDFSRDIESVRQELAENIRIFSNDLESRVEKATPNICKISRDVFSLKAIEPRGASVPDGFHKLVEMHKDAGHLPRETTKEGMDKEYLHFVSTTIGEAERVRKEGLAPRQKKLHMTTEEAVYSSFFVSAEKTKSFPNVAYLLARTATQSSCEAVTEGMGSVIQDVLGGRERIADEKLFQEVFVRLNGPKSTKKCDSVLEEAGDLRFGGRERWRFVKTSSKANQASKVLNKIEEEEDKFEDYC